MATRAQDKPTRAQLEAEHAVAMDALKAISMTAGRQSKELRIARRALHEIQHARISGQLPEVTKRSGV